MIRDSKPISLERWTRGEPLRSDKLNESVDAIGRLARGIAHPRQVRKVRGGKGEAQAGSTIVRLTFVGHNWDILICEDAEGEQFNVAKPPLLQPSRNLRQGEIAYEYMSSIERTAREDVTGVIELQEVVPMYLQKHETQNPFGHDVFAVAMSEEAIGELRDVNGELIEGVTLQELPSSRAWSATQRTVG